jgi:membrane protein required for colicin V production
MNYLDIVIIIILVLSAFNGYRKGFVVGIASLAALILGIYVALFFSDVMVALLTDIFSFQSKYLPIFAFILTFIIVVVAVVYIGKTIEKLVDLLLLGFLNKLAGAALGILKGTLILSLVIWIFNYFDSDQKIISQQSRSNSIFFEHVESIAPSLYNRLEFLHDIEIKDPFGKDEEDEFV